MKVGDRIELIGTSDIHAGLRAGDRGTIRRIRDDGMGTVVGVNWDSGSTLSLLPDEGDRFTVLTEDEVGA